MTEDVKVSKRNVGRFEECSNYLVGKTLYAMSLEGHCDDEVGSTQEIGWFGIILRPGKYIGAYILEMDEAGFFTYEKFRDEMAGQIKWMEIKKSYELFHDATADFEG